MSSRERRQAASQGKECITLPNPSSIATSVREPSSGEYALEAIYESGGRALSVSDEQILDMMRLLGREGLCVEPASAVAAAGLAHGRAAGWLSDDEWVVAVLTSSGIKWPQQRTMVTHGAATLEPTLSSLQAALSERGLAITSTASMASLP